MRWLIQTYFSFRVSFTGVAEDIAGVVRSVEWEFGDFITHVPMKPYDGVLYIGSFMNIDVARYYRYMWWSGRHLYYGVTEGPLVLSPFNYAAVRSMRVVVPSMYVRWELENAGIPVYSVVPHGVDVDGIRGADPRPWRKIFGDRVVVLYIAHRNIRKGFRQLVDAWRSSRMAGDSSVLLVLHTERKPNTNEDGYIIPEDGNIVVTDNVLKLDRRALYGLYMACDVYVHGALCEGFGIPVVEAMAAGKPVLCIDAGPMNEHIRDKEALVRVDRQEIYNDRGIANYRLNIPDQKEYIEKLEVLVYDASLRRELGRRNMERAEKYRVDKVYKELEKILIGSW